MLLYSLPLHSGLNSLQCNHEFCFSGGACPPTRPAQTLLMTCALHRIALHIFFYTTLLPISRTTRNRLLVSLINYDHHLRPLVCLSSVKPLKLKSGASSEMMITLRYHYFENVFKECAMRKQSRSIHVIDNLDQHCTAEGPMHTITHV